MTAVFIVQIVLLVAVLALWSYWPDLRRYLRRKREAKTRSVRRTPAELLAEYRRSGGEERDRERSAAIDAARAAGYHTMLDEISIYGDDPRLGPAKIEVQNYKRPFVHYLVMDVYEDDPAAPGGKKIVRIDVFRNDADRELVLSLGNLQSLDDKCRYGRDLSRHAVKGIALVGEKKGQTQEWHLDYYP